MHKNKTRQVVSVLCKCCFGTLLQKDFLLIAILHISSNSGLCTSSGILLADTATSLNYLHFRAKNAMSRTGGKFAIWSRLFSWRKATAVMRQCYMFQVIMCCHLLRSSHPCDPVSGTGVRGNLTNFSSRSQYKHFLFFSFWVSYTFNTQTACLQRTVNPPTHTAIFICKHNTILHFRNQSCDILHEIRSFHYQYV
jgi:hypothetical protein